MRHVNTTSLPKQSNLKKRLDQWSHTSQISRFRNNEEVEMTIREWLRMQKNDL